MYAVCVRVATHRVEEVLAQTRCAHTTQEIQQPGRPATAGGHAAVQEEEVAEVEERVDGDHEWKQQGGQARGQVPAAT